MSKAIQRFSLDVTHPDVQASVRIMQGDDNRQWRFTFTNGGQPFIIPARCTAMLVGTKPDDTVIENGLVVQGNEVIYDFGAADPENGIEQISTVPGSFEVQILLFDEYGAVLHAPRLWVTVFSSSYTERMANVSMDQFGGIKELIARLVGMEGDVETLLERMTASGTFVIPPTEWTDSTPSSAQILLGVNVFTAGCVVLIIPEDDATKAAAEAARMSMVINQTGDFDAPTPDSVMVARAEGGTVPTIPLNFRYVALKTGSTDKALVAMVGVDAVGAGGTGGTGSGVDEVAVRSIINQVVPEWARKDTPPEDAVKSVNGKKGDVNIPIPEVSKNAVGLGNVANERQYSEANPPPYPVKSVNGKTGAVSLGASDVGARPSTWTPTAEQVGADPANTAATKVSEHDTYTGSHPDIRLQVKELQEQVNKFLDVDDATRDELSEVLALIDANAGTLESLTSSKVNVADIINNLTTNVANKPLSAAQGVALKALIDALSTGKLDASALNAAITQALAEAKESGEFKGDPGSSVSIKSISESTASGGDNVVTFSDGKKLTVKNGKDGKDVVSPAVIITDTDEALTVTAKNADGSTSTGVVDKAALLEHFDAYIVDELAKRNQFVPIPVASVDAMTDTTKIYYLTSTGELWAYVPTQVVSGGYDNLADPTSSDWKTKSRLNASSAITTSVYDGSLSFVSNEISGSAGVKVYIKGVTRSERTEGTATQFGVVLYDSNGTQLNGKPLLLKQPVDGSGFTVTAGEQCWDAVNITDDGVYEWELGKNNAGNIIHTTIASFRVSGLAVTSAEDIIITVGQEIKDPEIVTEYAWAGTGHYISSEEAIAALESRVNVLEDEVEELTITVDRLKTNSSISMQSGAVWYALGDSITQGYASRVNASATNGYDQYVAAEGKRWVDYVASLNGYKLTNYGVGGTGYMHRTDNARAQVDGIDFSGCDLVTLAYGINDFKNAGTNIGTMDDDIEAGGSFVANMRYCIKKILTDNPLCKIIVITPINYRGLGTYASNYSIGYTGSNASCKNLDYLFDLMKQVCVYHGVEMIDMTHSSIVNRENIVTMLPDYVHPSEECHYVMGCELARKIKFA